MFHDMTVRIRWFQMNNTVAQQQHHTPTSTTDTLLLNDKRLLLTVPVVGEAFSERCCTLTGDSVMMSSWCSEDISTLPSPGTTIGEARPISDMVFTSAGVEAVAVTGLPLAAVENDMAALLCVGIAALV